jgi:excisionase family DNA binding protein
MTIDTRSPGPTIEALLKPDEVAAWFACSVDSVMRLCRDEGLPFRRMAGRKKRFVRSDVQAWLDGRRVVATATPARQDEAAPVKAAAPAAGSSWEDEYRKMRRPGKSPTLGRPSSPSDWRSEIRKVGRAVGRGRPGRCDP